MAVDFDAAWPDARARASAALVARGVQSADVDDVLQDVAVRAIHHRDRFASEEHLRRWCRRVALNLHVDAVRRRRRLSPLPFPEVPASDDTATAVERRIALTRLAAGMATLSPEDRRLLLESAPTASRQEAVRLAVRRHRLRARLAALVDGMAAAIAFLRRLPKRLPAPVRAGVVAAAPVVFATLLLGPLTMRPRPEVPQSIADPRASDALPVAVRQRAPTGTPPERARTVSAVVPVHEARPGTTHQLPTSPVRTIVGFDAGGQPFAVRHWRNGGGLGVCTGGLANVCVGDPRPKLPTPAVRSLIPPGG